MESLIQTIDKQSGAITLVLILAVLVLCSIVVWQMLSYQKLKRQWAALLTNPQGRSLEAMLMDHLKERVKTEDDIRSNGERLEELERKMKSAVRYVGAVRYDAFEDTGGQQSFSLAFFDEEGNGALITTLYGREDCRVFSKLLEGGRTDRSMTREEQKAVEVAGSKRQTVRMR